MSRNIWTCPSCGWRQDADRPRICGRYGEPCPGKLPNDLEAIKTPFKGSTMREEKYSDGLSLHRAASPASGLTASEAQRKSEGVCIDPRREWRCDGGWHRGWDGHDPFCERCPNGGR